MWTPGPGLPRPFARRYLTVSARARHHQIGRGANRHPHAYHVNPAGPNITAFKLRAMYEPSYTVFRTAHISVQLTSDIPSYIVDRLYPTLYQPNMLCCRRAGCREEAGWVALPDASWNADTAAAYDPYYTLYLTSADSARDRCNEAANAAFNCILWETNVVPNKWRAFFGVLRTMTLLAPTSPTDPAACVYVKGPAQPQWPPSPAPRGLGELVSNTKLNAHTCWESALF